MNAINEINDMNKIENNNFNFKKIINYMTPFQWFEVLGVTVITLFFAFTETQKPLWYTVINSAAAICGIFCVVLCAGGKRAQYYWGFANIVAYVIIAWIDKLYGEVMLNALYYFPTQFIGLWLWKKNKADDNGTVKSKKMKWWFTIILVVSCGLCIWLYQILLNRLGGNNTWLDSTTTVISIFANALMVLRYREQYLLWFVVNAVSVVMWAARQNAVMTVMWAFYLMNAVYGFIVWTKMNRNANRENK